MVKENGAILKTIVAIGGGEIGRIKIHEDGRKEQKPIETLDIDKKMIELTKKEHPNILFIGAASGDEPKYFDAVKNHFENHLECKVKNLVLTKQSNYEVPSFEEIKKSIMKADIIYVGGGNVTRLMKTLRETGADKLLKDAYNKGIIMAGNSAGGCVWFEYYDNDEDDDFDGTLDTLKTKEALGFLPGYFCPHWNTKNEEGIDKNSTSKKAIKEMLDREKKSGYAVDEGSGIMIQKKGDECNTKFISSKKYEYVNSKLVVSKESLPNISKIGYNEQSNIHLSKCCKVRD